MTYWGSPVRVAQCNDLHLHQPVQELTFVRISWMVGRSRLKSWQRFPSAYPILPEIRDPCIQHTMCQFILICSGHCRPNKGTFSVPLTLINGKWSHRIVVCRSVSYFSKPAASLIYVLIERKLPCSSSSPINVIPCLRLRED